MIDDYLIFNPILFHQNLYIYIQEVFQFYLNKFENAVTHLFLVILGNNGFP